MANDIYIDPLTNDLLLDPVEGAFRMCTTIQELTRQRVEITLRTFLNEWFYDTTFGTPYFESIFGKNKRNSADLAIKTTVLNVEGVVQIISYISLLDKTLRTLTISMTVKSDSGDIIPIEVSL